MYGLEAIEAHNGWAVAVVGVTIVFTGLVVLSAIISQLHKVLDFINNPRRFDFFKAAPAPRQEDRTVQVWTAAQKAAGCQFKILADTLDKNFALPRLLNRAVISGIEQPYSTVSLLVRSGVVIHNQDGFYHWDDEAFNRILSTTI